jgi:hypothetical protein
MRLRVFAAAMSLLLAPLVCHAAIVLTGSLTREFEVSPGKSYQGSVEVKNPDSTPQEIKAYQTDYFFYADGKVLYGEPGRLPRSNARWMTVSPRQVTIPPGETVSIRFTVQVPDDPTFTGTYWSMIMVEPLPEGSPESSSPGQKEIGIGVQQVMRYAIQVVTHIGDSGSRQLKFSQMRLSADNGRKVLAVDVENTGERWLRGTLWVDLYDSKGAYVGKYDGGKQRLYPGTSVRFTTELTGVQNATYKALIVVDCENDDVFGANVNLEIRE